MSNCAECKLQSAGSKFTERLVRVRIRSVVVSVRCGVRWGVRGAVSRGVGRGVRSGECGVRSLAAGIRSGESGVRSLAAGIRSGESGVRSLAAGIRSGESVGEWRWIVIAGWSVRIISREVLGFFGHVFDFFDFLSRDGANGQRNDKLWNDKTNYISIHAMVTIVNEMLPVTSLLNVGLCKRGRYCGGWRVRHPPGGFYTWRKHPISRLSSSVSVFPNRVLWRKETFQIVIHKRRTWWRPWWWGCGSNLSLRSAIGSLTAHHLQSSTLLVLGIDANGNVAAGLGDSARRLGFFLSKIYSRQLATCIFLFH